MKILKISFIAIYFILATFFNNTVIAQNDKLIVWINSDKGFNGLEKFATEFQKKTGVSVSVEHPDELTQKFQLAASAGKGPDIVFWAHDRLGTWQQAGLLSPIKPSKKTIDSIYGKAWDTFTIKDIIWGVPIGIESLFLIYNKDLVKTPPKSFEEIPALDTELQKTKKVNAILWGYNEIYYSWALFGANGGYVFKRKPNGEYDANDIGLNNKGSVMGMNMIVSLIKGGHLPKGVTLADPVSRFIDKKVAMIISGPWTLGDLNKHNFNYSVAPIPSVNKKPAAPWYGVTGGMITSASNKKEIAQSFLEMLASEANNMKLIHSDVPLGIPANKELYEEIKGKDLNIAVMFTSFENGTPMPNNKEMGAFWQVALGSLSSITNGKVAVQEGLDDAVLKIKNLSK